MALRALYSRTSCGCISQRMREKDEAHRCRPWSDFEAPQELSSGEAPLYRPAVHVHDLELAGWVRLRNAAIRRAAVFSPKLEVVRYFCKDAFASVGAPRDSESPQKVFLTCRLFAETLRPSSGSCFVQLPYVGGPENHA